MRRHARAEQIEWICRGDGGGARRGARGEARVCVLLAQEAGADHVVVTVKADIAGL